MAERPLVDVPKSVSPAVVEQFKVEKLAEMVFLDGLRGLVGELATKVGPRNSVYASMVRFLKSRI